MNKTIINIEEGIKFISDIPNYTIPKGHIIIDKGICGCGYTHWCLTNKQPTILCSPRKLLLENKMAQIDGLYYFRNEKEVTIDFDKSFSTEKAPDGISFNFTKVDINKEKQEREEYIMGLKQSLFNWLQLKANPFANTDAPKILVTYDSLHHVLEVIKKFQYVDFQIVVDEFQSIFSDANFKATVELDFVEYLKEWPNVCYLSATPMLDKYLDQLDYFNSLPYYEMTWPKSMTTLVKVNRRFTNSLVASCREIINSYRAGIFPKYVDQLGNTFYSKEVVFFINSVKTICDIVRKCNLLPEECNIICAESDNNLKRLRKLGSNFGYGKIPKRNEPNKMFTFCTRTAYLGADFYSTNASTIICSNINIKTLIVDVSLDLKQIMGRQRLDCNPFKNECLILYTADRKKDGNISLEEFQKNVSYKENQSEALLEIYNNISDEIGQSAYMGKLTRDRELYLNDYIGISVKHGKPVKNYLVQVGEMRAWEISQPEYQNTIMIRRELNSEFFEVNEVDRLIESDELVASLNQDLSKTKEFTVNMKTVCDFIRNYPDYYRNNYSNLSIIIPKKVLNYINQLGIDKIKSLGYKESILIKFIETNKALQSITVDNFFELGKVYTSKDIKSILQNIYNSNNLDKTAKASDIDQWFDVKKVVVNSVSGYRILNKK